MDRQYTDKNYEHEHISWVCKECLSPVCIRFDAVYETRLYYCKCEE